MELSHIPVLLHEAVDLLNVEDGKWYIDATFGRGGHTREILSFGGNVIALDHDKEAITYGMRHFVQAIEAKRIFFERENFEHIDDVVRKYDQVGKIHGVLADFGISSPQVDDKNRGFSFLEDAPLDMRMDDRLGVKARDLVNALGRNELIDLFTTYSQERHAKYIADAIVKERKSKPIETTQDLTRIIEKVVHREGHLHPATKVFQALRIVVNDELGSIERFLPKAFETLASGDRLVTIAFHEGEDRLVKHFEQDLIVGGDATAVTSKPIEPSDEEVANNPRSRSGKLRVIEKI